MLFQRILDEQLAQYAYLVGCQETGDALVIDPQRDIDRYRRIARLSFGAVLSLALPAIAFLVAEAESIIGLCLGPQWTEAVPVFRILAAAAFMGCAGRTMIWVYVAEGRTSARLRWTLFSRPVSILFVVAGIPWGAVGIASGYAVGKVLLSLANVHHCLGESPLTQRDFFCSAARPASAAVLASVLILAVSDGNMDPLGLALDLLAYTGIYAAVWLGIPGGLSNVREILGWLRA